MKKPTTAQLTTLGKQMAATVIRGVSWPTKNLIKGCWENEELPNIDMDAEIFLDPSIKNIESTFLKLRKIIIVPNKDEQAVDFNYSVDRKERIFSYGFYLKKPVPKKLRGSKKVKSWVSCKAPKSRKTRSNKLCRMVRYKDRQLFRITGKLRTPSPERNAELKALKAEGMRGVVPGFEVYFGDLWATKFLRVIRKKCGVDSAL